MMEILESHLTFLCIRLFGNRGGRLDFIDLETECYVLSLSTCL